MTAENQMSAAKRDRMIQSGLAEALGICTGKAAEILATLPDDLRGHCEEAALSESRDGMTRCKQIMVAAHQRMADESRKAREEEEGIESDSDSGDEGNASDSDSGDEGNASDSDSGDEGKQEKDKKPAPKKEAKKKPSAKKGSAKKTTEEIGETKPGEGESKPGSDETKPDDSGSAPPPSPQS